MKRAAYLAALILCGVNPIFGQSERPDSTGIIQYGADLFQMKPIVVTAGRLPVTLKNNPGSVSVITPGTLRLMPKKIGVEEALRLVPGVRIDNQHDGERVHVSIRGQGILTERGLRGIGVLIDGFPVNDPSGFAPDLYDVDWAAVNNVEVIRGPAAGLYGTGGAAGVLYITTDDGGSKPVGGEIAQSAGSNGFLRSRFQLDGSKGAADYRLSYSRTGGDGYRDHQAYWSNKLYEKLNFKPMAGLSVTQIVSHTDYFQQNPEGLNRMQFDDLRQANPDARPFNEYQKTSRTTIGLRGTCRIDRFQDVAVTTYLRNWNYKETSNKCAEYRTVTHPGAAARYTVHARTGGIRHDFSLGTDLKWQKIRMVKFGSAADPDRVESLDETNLETGEVLANQVIGQRSLGAFFLYQAAVGKFHLTGNVRYDRMRNDLTDKMMAPDTARTSEDFSNVSGRLGASIDLAPALTVFANWSQGFMPPSTEELASNPLGYSGFNTHLVPSTSNCYEAGIRGYRGGHLFYDLAVFYMKTRNDFFRFKQTGRGNQEVFYGNAGNSRRYGIESYLSFKVNSHLSGQIAYTYADYRYTSAAVDPVYTDTAYVLTTPPEAGQWLPNSPRHQLSAELVYTFTNGLRLNLGTECQSRWAIYTDAMAYQGKLDPAIYENWQEGFQLFHAGVTCPWHVRNTRGELGVFARNFTGETYMAFTEPDPDGNAYQPGPSREIFGEISIRL